MTFYILDGCSITEYETSAGRPYIGPGSRTSFVQNGPSLPCLPECVCVCVSACICVCVCLRVCVCVCARRGGKGSQVSCWPELTQLTPLSLPPPLPPSHSAQWPSVCVCVCACVHRVTVCVCACVPQRKDGEARVELLTSKWHVALVERKMKWLCTDRMPNLWSPHLFIFLLKLFFQVPSPPPPLSLHSSPFLSLSLFLQCNYHWQPAPCSCVMTARLSK